MSEIETYNTAVSDVEVNAVKNLFHGLENNLSSWKWIRNCP